MSTFRSRNRYCPGCGTALPFNWKSHFCDDLCGRAAQNKRTKRQQQEFEKAEAEKAEQKGGAK